MAQVAENASEEARWLVCTAELHEYAGKYSEALELCEQCTRHEMVLFADDAIGKSILKAQFRQSLVAHKMGDTPMAIAVLEDCFKAMSFQFDVRGLCLVQLNLGHLYLVQHSKMSTTSSLQKIGEQSAAQDHVQMRQKQRLAADKDRMLAAAQTLIDDYWYLLMLDHCNVLLRSPLPESCALKL